MKTRLLLVAAMLMTCSLVAHAQDSKPKSGGKAAAPKMDQQAMMEMMEKMGAPGPNHAMLAKMAGDWNFTIKWSMDPSQPMQESKGTATYTTLMDGRFCQEQVNGDMMGRPFNGMGLTGYDNAQKKYVGTWIDNMGTGMMTSQGTPDASGNVVNWKGQSADPMTGKAMTHRMVSRFVDDNHMTYEMFGPGPTGKEYKMMEIAYERKI
jgi:hypothetical protein